MYLSVCTLHLQAQKPPLHGGGDRAAAVVLSLFWSVSRSRASTLAFLNPEFGNACVCTDPPPPICMYEGLPPHTHKWRGGVCTPTHSQIQESGTQEYFLCLICIYIYICTPSMLQCAVPRMASLRSVLVCGILNGLDIQNVGPPKRLGSAGGLRRGAGAWPPKRRLLRPPMRRRLASVDAPAGSAGLLGAWPPM